MSMLLRVCILSSILLATPGMVHAAEPDVVDIDFKQFEFKLPRNETFDIEKYVPEAARKLVGQRVRLRGFIHPSIFAEEFQKFVLVETNNEMNFGNQVMVADNCVVQMKESTSTKFTTRPIIVEGVFALQTFPDDKGTINVYRLNDAEVKPIVPAVR